MWESGRCIARITREQHGAVADAGVEHAHGRRARMDVGELERDAVAHHPLLAAGVDEQQIFLPVVEEAEIARGSVGRRPARRGPARRLAGAGALARDHDRRAPACADSRS
jgi:hypothetical protein